MKDIKLILGLFSVIALVISGCDKEEYGIDAVTPTEPVIEGLTGTDSLGMGGSASFSVEAPRTAAGSTYSWTVEGGTASATSGDAISVTFDGGSSVTEATISVVETTVDGMTGSAVSTSVKLGPVPLTYTAAWEATAPLKDGDSARLGIVFDLPLQTLPGLTLLNGGGSFSSLVDADTALYTYYTHEGGGDGTIDFEINGARAVDLYGGLTMATGEESIITIDNTAPTATVTASPSSMQPGATSLITIKFSEEMASTLTEFTYLMNGEDIVDSKITFTTEDFEEYTATYTPSLEADAPEDGITENVVVSLDGDLEDIKDPAGNAIATLPAGTLTVDNIAPDALSVFGASAGPDDTSVTLTATSFSTTDVVHYVMLPYTQDGADLEAPDAPEEFSEFTGLSGSLGGTTTAKTLTIDFVDYGTYDVYFVVEDAAGNLDEETIVGPATIEVEDPNDTEVDI